MYKVYVRVDENNRIIEINSSEFIKDKDLEGWTRIDAGEGDKYHHAQGNYFDKPILNEYGMPVYRLADGKAVERTAEEIQADTDALPPPLPTLEERLIEAEAKARLLLEVIKDTLTDAQAVKNKNIYPHLMTLVGQEVTVGQKVRYGDDLIKVEKDHVVSADILPGSKEAFELYSKVLPADAPYQEEPTVKDYPIWAATGVYNLNDEVTEGGKVYKSLKNQNWDRPNEGVKADPPTWEYLFDL
jgi:hypothetical protein